MTKAQDPSRARAHSQPPPHARNFNKKEEGVLPRAQALVSNLVPRLSKLDVLAGCTLNGKGPVSRAFQGGYDGTRTFPSR